MLQILHFCLILLGFLMTSDVQLKWLGQVGLRIIFSIFLRLETTLESEANSLSCEQGQQAPCWPPWGIRLLYPTWFESFLLHWEPLLASPNSSDNLLTCQKFRKNVFLQMMVHLIFFSVVQKRPH